MMIKKFKLFTTLACPTCMEIKSFLDASKISIQREDISAVTDEGLRQASIFAVSSVPTLIFLDEKNKEIARARSVDEIKKILGL